MPALPDALKSPGSRSFMAEFVGMTVFLFGLTLGVTASEGNQLLIAAACTSSLVMAIYVAINVSGGQLNPAVTFALTISGNLSPITACTNVIAQCLGAIAGSALAAAAHPHVIGALAPGVNVTMKAVVIGEIVGTFILCLVVFACAVHDKNKEAPLIIGSAVFALHLALVSNSGCGLNPARFLGTALAQSNWPKASAAYVIAPFIGALLSVPIQYVMFDSTKPAADKPKPDPADQA